MKHFNYFSSIILLCLSVSSFGQAGLLDTEFNTTGYYSYDNGFNEIFQDVMVQDDQKIVCSGVRLTQSFTAELTVLRLNPDGTLDTSFGDDGIFSFSAGPEAYATKCLQAADGKLILAGLNM